MLVPHRKEFLRIYRPQCVLFCYAVPAFDEAERKAFTELQQHLLENAAIETDRDSSVLFFANTKADCGTIAGDNRIKPRDLTHAIVLGAEAKRFEKLRERAAKSRPVC